MKPGGDVCKVALATSVSRHLNKPGLTRIGFFFSSGCACLNYGNVVGVFHLRRV